MSSRILHAAARLLRAALIGAAILAGTAIAVLAAGAGAHP